MKSPRKISVWAMGGAGAFLVLLCLLLVFTAWRLEDRSIGDRVKAFVSQAVGGTFDFERFDGFFFPRPGITFTGCRLILPDLAEFTIESVTIHPELIPLMTGKFRISRMVADAPVVEWRLDRPGETRPGSSRSSPLESVESAIAGACSLVAARTSGFALRINRGQVTFLGGNGFAFTVSDIDIGLSMPGNVIHADLNCRSEWWRHLQMRGRLDAKTFKSTGKIDIQAFRTQPFIDAFHPAVPVVVESAATDLAVEFEADRCRELTAAVLAQIPGIEIKRGDENVVVSGDRLAGKVAMDATRTSLVLTEAGLTNPRMKVSGQLVMGPLNRIGSSPVRLELTGIDVDVPVLREAVRIAAGDDSGAGPVLDVVRGGEIPKVRLFASGPGPDALMNAQNYTVEGRIARGRVYIPGADVHLDQVDGEVVVSKEFLKGTGLKARLGNTRGQSGTLTLVWHETELLIDLDIGVRADLAQLPPLLKKWVDNGEFVNELDRLNGFEGRAEGRLILGGSTSDLETRAEVSSFSLTADYRRAPYPIVVQAGGFDYLPGGIQLKNLKGSIGKTTFADLSADFDWAADPHLKIVALQSVIHAEQIHPWSRFWGPEDAPFRKIQAMTGRLELDAMRLDGPLFKPALWQMETRGRLHDLSVHWDPLPEPMTLAAGAFHLVETDAARTLAFEGANLHLMGSDLTVSGQFNNFFRDFSAADIRFRGEIGEGLARRLHRLLRVPAAVHPRSPLSVDRCHWIWNRGQTNHFTGEMRPVGGPVLTMGIALSDPAKSLAWFHVRDTESDATVGIETGHGVFGVDFSGHLTVNTLHRLFADYPLSDGWIKGDIQFELDPSFGFAVNGSGNLTGNQITIPGRWGEVLAIDHIVLGLEGNRLTVSPAEVAWEGRPMVFSGTVFSGVDKWDTQLSMTAKALNWDRLKEGLAKWFKMGPDGVPGGKRFPLSGNLEIQVDRFEYGKMVFTPLRADMTLSKGDIEIAVAKANRCGIDMPGVIKISGGKMTLDLQPFAAGLDVNPTSDCLWKDRVQATGTLDLAGHVTADVQNGALGDNLEGSLVLQAQNGNIYHHVPLSRLFAYLDFVEIFKQIIPNLKEKGFAFRSILVKARLKGHTMVIEEGIIDSPTMGIVLQGEVDTADDTLNLEVLLAPMQSVNWVIKKLPVVNQIMGGKLISVPMKLEGSWESPQVTALSPKMVGKGLAGLFKRIVTLPVQMLPLDAFEP